MFKIEVDDNKLQAVLTGLILNESKKGQLFNELGINLVENARLRFSEGVDPKGAKWPISIRARETNGQTLLNTGTLRNSLAHIVETDGVQYGTDLFYAKTLNYGKTIKPVTAQWLTYKIGNRTVRSKKSVIPPRQFVGISNEDELMVVDIINSFLQRQIN